MREKYVGEKSLEKSAKTSFLYSHECRDLKWVKNARNKFSRNKPIERTKNVGKKIVAKNCEKKLFLYSHEYRDQKMGGKTRETIYLETQQIVRANNVWKKLRNIIFYINTNIVTKKWWKKRGKQLFHKHTNCASKK